MPKVTDPSSLMQRIEAFASSRERRKLVRMLTSASKELPKGEYASYAVLRDLVTEKVGVELDYEEYRLALAYVSTRGKSELGTHSIVSAIYGRSDVGRHSSVRIVGSAEQQTSDAAYSEQILDELVLIAERGVIGSLLIDESQLGGILPILEPAHFTHQPQRVIYEQLLSIHREGQPLEAMSLLSRLREAGKLDYVGGHAELAKCGDIVSGHRAASYLAMIVRSLRPGNRESIPEHKATKIRDSLFELMVLCGEPYLVDIVSFLNSFLVSWQNRSADIDSRTVAIGQGRGKQQSAQQVAATIADMSAPDLALIADSVLDAIEVNAPELRKRFKEQLSESRSEEHKKKVERLSQLEPLKFIERMAREDGLPKKVRLQALKAHLKEMAGAEIDAPLETKKAIASGLQGLADEFGLAFVGPKAPVDAGRLFAVSNGGIDYFRVVRPDTSVAGSYREFPELRLVDAPSKRG